MLVDSGVCIEACKQAGIVGEFYLGKDVVVHFQDADDGRQQHHVKLCAGLDTGGAWYDEVAVMLFGFGKIGSHEVGVAEAGIALDEEEVECLAKCTGRCFPVAEDVKFFHREVCAWLGLASALTELVVWVVLDDAEGDGIIDEGAKTGMVGLDGIVFK